MVITLASLAFAAACGDSAPTPIDDPSGPEIPDDIEVTDKYLIDDLEDKDGAIKEHEDRGGSWYCYKDEMGGTLAPPADDFTPIAEGFDSAAAASIKGDGIKEYVGMGFDLNDDGTGAKPKLTYDASAFDGITFVAKGLNNETVKFGVAIPATVFEEEGGTCSVADNEAGKCSDIHFKSIKLTGEWQRFVVPFDQLKQGAWGTPASFDKKNLIGVQFNMEAIAKYEIVVDDLSFYKNK